MAESKVLTVAQVSELIRMLLEGNPLLRSITVKGEISNLTVNRTGHVYFSLKDSDAVLRAVMFRSSAEKLRFQPESGSKVLVRGRITVYPGGGAYQIVADDIIPDGVGALQLAFEQLKRRLAAEGLFEKDRKRPIPKIPRTVGVITSPTGAAFQDILNISSRRFPFARIVLYPAAVQGETAVSQLCAGISVMANAVKPDVIILGRGGGSAEDLQAFNQEPLVRAVAACPIPIISAVGHEIDFTLCDFAADMRAPTPSAAAELAFPDTAEIKRRFENVQGKMTGLVQARLAAYRRELAALAESRSMREPRLLLDTVRERLSHTEEALMRGMQHGMEAKTNRFVHASVLLDALSPMKVLSRGYALVADTDGRMLRTVSSVERGSELTVRLHDGCIRAEVTDVRENAKEMEYGTE